ncbi:MAG: alpha/beta hydrolase [Actinomycetales bacterium mxb001]|nr:MAG: alpha/beta hydrolase [Actinomycetales bacterium mxb001]
MEIEHRDIVTNGVRLHCAIAGPVDGDLVIALHGFPEFWRGMTGVIVSLARAGYRVVAPDQRGYNLSEKPEGIDAYNVDEMALDVVGIIDAMGRESAHVVGHDWGAAVAWWLALTRPERVRRLVVINVPHPSVFAREVRGNKKQMRKSWYIFAIQVPAVPERVAFGRRTRQRFSRAIAGTANPGSFTPDYLAQLREAWAQPGAAQGMLNWYRASVRRRPGRLTDKRVHVPTLIIWGRKDVALSDTMVQPSADLCDDVRVEWFDDATHWVLHDEPERTSALILDFLSA